MKNSTEYENAVSRANSALNALAESQTDVGRLANATDLQDALGEVKALSGANPEERMTLDKLFERAVGVIERLQAKPMKAMHEVEEKEEPLRLDGVLKRYSGLGLFAGAGTMDDILSDAKGETPPTRTTSGATRKAADEGKNARPDTTSEDEDTTNLSDVLNRIFGDSDGDDDDGVVHVTIIDLSGDGTVDDGAEDDEVAAYVLAQENYDEYCVARQRITTYPVPMWEDLTTFTRDNIVEQARKEIATWRKSDKLASLEKRYAAVITDCEKYELPAPPPWSASYGLQEVRIAESLVGIAKVIRNAR